jgi:hypothetical protein
MPELTRAEKMKAKKAEIKAAEEAEAKKPKPKPRPAGVVLPEPIANQYMMAAVGNVTGIKRGNPRMVTYIETEDELKKLLEAYEKKLKVS